LVTKYSVTLPMSSASVVPESDTSLSVACTSGTRTVVTSMASILSGDETSEKPSVASASVAECVVASIISSMMCETVVTPGSSTTLNSDSLTVSVSSIGEISSKSVIVVSVV